MKTLLERSHKGFICTPESDLIIPIVNGFINQELYQECYNWVASYYKLPIRFFPLFREGAYNLDEEKAQLMQTKYKINCTPIMLLTIFRTYFKDTRDLRALTLAYANTLKNVNLPEEDKVVFSRFLEATESETRHINYIAKIKTITTLQESLKFVDLALRANRTNFVETLLILETAENATMLGRLINIYEEDFKFMFSLPEYAIKENICIYLWFFEKVLKCLDAYKSLKDFPFIRALCRGCKSLTQKVVYSENDFNRLRKLFGWSDDLIRYINLLCLTHLRARFFPHNSHVRLSEYVESSAILFSNLVRKKEWLEEAEIVFDLYEFGQEQVQYTDLMKTFVQFLDTKEPLEFFEDVYKICAKYPMEIAQLMKCGFLRNTDCTTIEEMNEEAKTLTFYNRLRYKSAEEVLQSTTSQEIVEVLSSEKTNTDLFMEILGNDYFNKSELTNMILNNAKITRNFKFVLKHKDLSSIKDIVLSVLENASFEYLKETLDIFIPTYYFLRNMNVNILKIDSFVESTHIKNDKDFMKVLAPKIPYIGLLTSYEGFFGVIAIYLKEYPEHVEDSEELLEKIKEYTNATTETLIKIAENIMSEEKFLAYQKNLYLEEEGNLDKQLEELKDDFKFLLQHTEEPGQVLEEFYNILEEVDNSEIVKDLMDMMLSYFRHNVEEDIYYEIIENIQSIADEYDIAFDYEEAEEEDE